jgi:hypothetical protein
LNGAYFQVEQHSCNCQSVILLIKNNEIIFLAHCNADQPTKITISSSKLNETDVQNLAVIANAIEANGKVDYESWISVFTDRLKSESDNEIKKSF